MIPPWVDRAVFHVTRMDLAALDDVVRLGFNAVCVVPQNAAFEERVAKAFVDAAHRKELRVCADLSHIDGSLDAIASWDGVGADAVKLQTAGAGTRKPARACIVAEQHSVQPDVVSYLTTTLFRVADGHAYFDAHGLGDFGAFWREFDALHRACGTDSRIALGTSEYHGPPLRDGRELDDLEVIYTFLLTWPIMPFVASGDEAGGAAFERMLYLRLTESDLAADATLELLSSPSPGYPLLYRRGSAIVVALNPGATAHRVDLESVGDAAPLVTRHCHLAHTGGRWTARLGPAGYGVFNVA